MEEKEKAKGRGEEENPDIKKMEKVGEKGKRRTRRQAVKAGERMQEKKKKNKRKRRQQQEG